MKPSSVTSGRAYELLIERALRGLDDREHRELTELGAEDDDSFDLAAAAIAVTSTSVDAMPASIAARIASAAGAPAVELGARGPATELKRTLPGVVVDLGPRPTAEPIATVTPIRTTRDRARRASTTPRRAWGVVPWLAAAACLIVAFGAWWWAGHREPEGVVATVPRPERARDELIASATDLARLDWHATEDPTAHAASGDVVWSAAQQRGFMRFVGLAPNDRTQFQYQLWIFDKRRDERFPVDGGVFDVSSNGEVVIPISAKLHVDEATLFAVTIEKPGGVVVSKRERIVVTAARS